MVPVPELKKLPDGPGQPRPIHVALEQKPPDQIGRGPEDQGDGDAKHILAPQGLQGQVAPRVQKQRPGAHEKQRHGTPQQRAPKEIRRPRRRAKGPVEPAHGGGVDEHRAEDGDGPHQVQVQLTGLGWERHTVPSSLPLLGDMDKTAAGPSAGRRSMSELVGIRLTPETGWPWRSGGTGPRRSRWAGPSSSAGTCRPRRS